MSIMICFAAASVVRCAEEFVNVIDFSSVINSTSSTSDSGELIDGKATVDS
jgi:hypothetical protein